jgi:subtilisin-like proprotein convertase family protein
MSTHTSLVRVASLLALAALGRAQFQALDPFAASMAGVGGNHSLYGAVPPGTTPSTVTVASSGAQSNRALNAYSLIAHAVHGTLWDVDVRVDVQHADGAELDIYLIAPNGRRVTLSTDNASGVLNAFTDTTFDDSSSTTVLEQVFTNGGSAVVVPEGALGSLVGIDPFGNWQLQVLDDTGAISGTLISWSIVLTTLSPAPPPIDYTVHDFQAFSTNIPDNNSAGRYGYAFVMDSGVQLSALRLGLNINHPRPSDLVITLTSPEGTEITLARKAGGSTVNFFGSAEFRDDAQFAGLDAPVSDFTAGVPTVVVPEGALARFAGESAEGAWSVHVVDTAAGMVGQLLGVWIDADVWTVGGASTGFCPVGTSTEGCQPVITNAGSVLSLANVPGSRMGVFFFGTNGPRYTPWAVGSTSYLCARGPLRRTPAMFSGGHAGMCDGVYQFDLAGIFAAEGVVSGTTVHAQCWYRDPPAPKFTNLSGVVVFAAP